jgi:hypothetical protein
MLQRTSACMFPFAFSFAGRKLSAPASLRHLQCNFGLLRRLSLIRSSLKSARFCRERLCAGLLLANFTVWCNARVVVDVFVASVFRLHATFMFANVMFAA